MSKVSIKLTTGALLPTYHSKYAAGCDIHANLELQPLIKENATYSAFRKILTIEPFGRVLIKTGIQMAIPEGYELQIRPRSGLALQGIIVANSPGTIDSDYRGDIGIILINLSDMPVIINDGDRIAQGVLAPVIQITEWDIVDELPTTERGEGGFGSTGV